jgi:ferric-dicitrate binding protein FerR (iron transport regulator)
MSINAPAVSVTRRKPLAEAVAEFNRHNKQRMVARDPANTSFGSGAVDVTDLSSFAAEIQDSGGCNQEKVKRSGIQSNSPPASKAAK